MYYNMHRNNILSSKYGPGCVKNVSLKNTRKTKVQMCLLIRASQRLSYSKSVKEKFCPARSLDCSDTVMPYTNWVKPFYLPVMSTEYIALYADNIQNVWLSTDSVDSCINTVDSKFQPYQFLIRLSTASVESNFCTYVDVVRIDMLGRQQRYGNWYYPHVHEQRRPWSDWKNAHASLSRR